MNDHEKIISVIIATRNRAEMLAKCLDALASVDDAGVGWKALVVNNASGDETADVLRREAGRGRLPLRIVDEPHAGLANARNAGIAAARGDFLVFLDDDALVAEGWLKTFDRLYRDEGRDLIQGRVLVQLPGPRPRWLTAPLRRYLSELDLGDRPCPMSQNLLGGNLGVSRAVFAAIGGFRADLGAGAAGFGEDTEFGLRAAAAGFCAVYEPDALVHHVIPPARVTRRALLRRARRGGASQPLFQHYDDPAPAMLFYLARISAWRLLCAAARLPSGGYMEPLCAMAEHVGRVRAILRQRRA